MQLSPSHCNPKRYDMCSIYLSNTVRIPSRYRTLWRHRFCRWLGRNEHNVLSTTSRVGHAAASANPYVPWDVLSSLCPFHCKENRENTNTLLATSHKLALLEHTVRIYYNQANHQYSTLPIHKQYNKNYFTWCERRRPSQNWRLCRRRSWAPEKWLQTIHQGPGKQEA